jgi:hypothetical protein
MMTSTMITMITMVPMPINMGVPLGSAPASWDGAASIWPGAGRAGGLPRAALGARSGSRVSYFLKTSVISAAPTAGSARKCSQESLRCRPTITVPLDSVYAVDLQR